MRRAVPIWLVRIGSDLYVRSVNGPTAAWYRGATASHQAHIEAAGVMRDVDLVGDDSVEEQIDQAYRAKYAYFPSGVSHITSPQARATTLKLVPRT